jgi:hypothetical protein
VRAATRAAGYLAAFAYDAGLADACDDLFALPRIPIDGRDGVVGLAIKLAAGEDGWTSIKRRTPPALKRLARFLNRISTYPSQHD